MPTLHWIGKDKVKTITWMFPTKYWNTLMVLTTPPKPHTLSYPYLSLCIDGVIKEGRPVVVSMGLRRKFIDEVVNLNL